MEDINPLALEIDPLEFGQCGKPVKGSSEWTEPKVIGCVTNVCEFWRYTNTYLLQENRWANIYVAKKGYFPSWSTGLLKGSKGNDLNISWKGLKLEEFQKYVKYILVNFIEHPTYQQAETKYQQWQNMLCFEFEFKNGYRGSPDTLSNVKVWGTEKLDSFLLESEIKEQIRDFSPPDCRVNHRSWPRP